LESLARTTRDSYERVLDHAAAMQERNVRFAQEMVEGSITELREQAESNRAMALELQSAPTSSATRSRRSSKNRSTPTWTSRSPRSPTTRRA
jgi:hypothetical protein